MVYVNCFFYGINISDEELSKYAFPKNSNTIQNSSNIDFKKFNQALKIHNLTIVNKYRENKVLSLTELIGDGNNLGNGNGNGNINNSEEIEKTIERTKETEIITKNDSEPKLTRTMKSYKSVRNLGDLENESNSQTSLFSDNINYLINKTSDIVINSLNGIRQVPELIDYYTYSVYD